MWSAVFIAKNSNYVYIVSGMWHSTVSWHLLLSSFTLRPQLSFGRTFQLTIWLTTSYGSTKQTVLSWFLHNRCSDETRTLEGEAEICHIFWGKPCAEEVWSITTSSSSISVIISIIHIVNKQITEWHAYFNVIITCFESWQLNPG